MIGAMLLIGGESGLLCEVYSVESLAEAMEKMALDEVLRMRYGQQALNVHENTHRNSI